jgi:predicted nucleotidyltransferase
MNVAGATLEEIEPILIEFGRRHDVIQKLEIFGSIATGRANSASDLDVLITLSSEAPANLKYFSFFPGLQKELEESVGRKVDLIDRGALNQDAFSHNATHGVKTVYERR